MTFITTLLLGVEVIEAQVRYSHPADGRCLVATPPMDFAAARRIPCVN